MTILLNNNNKKNKTNRIKSHDLNLKIIATKRIDNDVHHFYFIYVQSIIFCSYKSDFFFLPDI